MTNTQDTTPARAEAQDEGGAGERFAYLPLDRGAYRADLIDYLNGFITGGSGRCREGLEGMGVTIAAHSSPTPSADADRVRIAVEALEVKINAPLTGPTHGAWDRGRIAGLKEALAALKSEGK